RQAPRRARRPRSSAGRGRRRFRPIGAAGPTRLLERVAERELEADVVVVDVAERPADHVIDVDRLARVRRGHRPDLPEALVGPRAGIHRAGAAARLRAADLPSEGRGELEVLEEQRDEDALRDLRDLALELDAD